MNQIDHNYDELPDEQKELWTKEDYASMCEMVNRYYNSFEKSINLIGLLSSIVHKYPKYQSVLDRIDSHCVNKDRVEKFTDNLIGEIYHKALFGSEEEELIE